MSNWTDMAGDANAELLQEFGDDATFVPQDNSGAQSIQGILIQPGVAEETSGGFGKKGTVVRLWVNIETISPAPKDGDTVQYSGINYTVAGIDPDVNGGAVLKLVKN